MTSVKLALTRQETADALGVHPATIDRLVKVDPKFPRPAKFGGALVRFLQADVEAYLKARRSAKPHVARTRKTARRMKA